jgi:hypothetical protein
VLGPVRVERFDQDGPDTGRFDSPVIIVEGFFSTMRMTELGVPWSVSILGSSMSLQQEDFAV